MKSTFYPVVISAALLITTFACTKNVPTPYVPVIYSGQDYLENYAVPPVLYQVVFIDKASEKASGFFIDDAGQLRTFKEDQTKELYLRNTVSPVPTVALAQIKENSTVSEVVVDVNKVVELYKRLAQSRDEAVESHALTTSSNVITAFYAYTYAYDNHGEDCPEMRINDYYSQIPLSIESDQLYIYDSSLSPEIIEWLQSLKVFNEARESL